MDGSDGSTVTDIIVYKYKQTPGNIVAFCSR